VSRVVSVVSTGAEQISAPHPTADAQTLFIPRLRGDYSHQIVPTNTVRASISMTCLSRGDPMIQANMTQSVRSRSRWSEYRYHSSTPPSSSNLSSTIATGIDYID